jgi:uncharacterized RDD family membrane protein YckC
MQWYYAFQQQRQGPVSDADFHRLVSEGVIQPSTLVWRAGMPNWQTYETIAPTLIPPIPNSAPAFRTASAPASTAASTSAPASAPGSADETAVCLISGKRYPKREMIEYQGRWVSMEHREEFFRRIREGEIMPREVQFAGFWIRFVAWVINFIIVYIIWQILDFVLIVTHVTPPIPANLNPFDPSMAPIILRGALPGMFVNFAFAIAYSAFFNRRFGATPGKMIFGLKTVMPDGERVGTGRLILRAILQIITGMLGFVGFFFVGIDDEKRGLPDFVCGTRVIKTR